MSLADAAAFSSQESLRYRYILEVALSDCGSSGGRGYGKSSDNGVYRPSSIRYTLVDIGRILIANSVCSRPSKTTYKVHYNERTGKVIETRARFL